MAGWHHRLSGHESGKLQENSGGHRSRVCHSPWGHKESDVSQPLNNNNIILSHRRHPLLPVVLGSPTDARPGGNKDKVREQQLGKVISGPRERESGRSQGDSTRQKEGRGAQNSRLGGQRERTLSWKPQGATEALHARSYACISRKQNSGVSSTLRR